LVYLGSGGQGKVLKLAATEPNLVNPDSPGEKVGETKADARKNSPAC